MALADAVVPSGEGYYGQDRGYGGLHQPGRRTSGPHISHVGRSKRPKTMVWLTVGNTISTAGIAPDGTTITIECVETKQRKTVVTPNSVSFEHASGSFSYYCPEFNTGAIPPSSLFIPNRYSGT